MESRPRKIVAWFIIGGLAILTVFLLVLAGREVINIFSGGGNGEPDVAALNAEASPAATYAGGKAFARAIEGALVASCTSPGGQGIDQVQCTLGSGDASEVIGAYVGLPGKLPGVRYSLYLASFKKSIAETQPVGETALLLIGKRWFVHGDKGALIDVQEALGGRLVVLGQ